MKIRIMEFLFTDKWAFIEALIVLLCLLVVMIIGLYEGYNFLRKFFGVFEKRTPQQPALAENVVTTISAAENTNPTEVTNWEPDADTTQDDTNIAAPISDDPDAIYDEYVALVEETHREKEEEQSIHTWDVESIESKVDHLLTNQVQDVSIPPPAVDEPLQNNALTDQPEVDTEVHENAHPATETPPEFTSHIESQPETVPEWTIERETTSETTTIETQGEVSTDLESSWNIETPTEMDLDSESTQEIDPLASQEIATETEEKDEILPPEDTSAKEVEDTRETTTLENPPQEWVKEKNQNETIFAIVNAVKTLIARKETTEARTLIIQWLAIDKHHRDLNLLLGSLYETERQFEKAEYVYKDLAIEYPNNIEILEKLWNVLIIEKRYSIALEIYKKILDIGGETEWTLYILSHLCHEIGDASEGHLFMKKYLKQWPNNPEVLSLMWNAEIELGKRKDAIETLKRLKNLTPYNEEITATLQKLMMEEELAGNFWDTNTK